MCDGASKVSLSFDCAASKRSLQDNFYDGMSCVGIAATGMNRFKGHGSLNNFASVTQGFLLQHPFQTSLSNLVLGTVVHKPSNPSR